MIRVDVVGQQVEDKFVALRADAPDRIDVVHAIAAVSGEDRLPVFAQPPIEHSGKRAPVDACRHFAASQIDEGWQQVDPAHHRVGSRPSLDVAFPCHD